MTRDNSQMPEWMEIAESDASSAQVRKVSKKLPAFAVVVTGAIIATGAILANASEEQSANAEVATTQAAATATPSTSSSPSASATPDAIQNPTIDTPAAPQRGERGDDDGDHEERGDDDGDHEEHGDRPERPDHDGDHEGRERGEHHERGSAGTTTANPTLPSAGTGA